MTPEVTRGEAQAGVPWALTLDEFGTVIKLADPRDAGVITATTLRDGDPAGSSEVPSTATSNVRQVVPRGRGGGDTLGERELSVT